MGFGGEDRFVIITDGEPLMNVVLFWRDAIPEDWEPIPHAPARRIAGMLPATMGAPALEAIQSEQSVVVAGYGAGVVNNIARNPSGTEIDDAGRIHYGTPWGRVRLAPNSGDD